MLLTVMLLESTSLPRRPKLRGLLTINKGMQVKFSPSMPSLTIACPIVSSLDPLYIVSIRDEGVMSDGLINANAILSDMIEQEAPVSVIIFAGLPLMVTDFITSSTRSCLYHLQCRVHQRACGYPDCLSWHTFPIVFLVCIHGQSDQACRTSSKFCLRLGSLFY
eukprot:Pompholyxophrys_punicea_v1_NODE_227_length_2683_cov_13.396650.p4 type:complete len:164 gc:universal NODE_227_length_2683_cov_13.396650:2024-2515(+)